MCLRGRLRSNASPVGAQPESSDRGSCFDRLLIADPDLDGEQAAGFPPHILSKIQARATARPPGETPKTRAVT
jgi:hypothetical protein